MELVIHDKCGGRIDYRAGRWVCRKCGAEPVRNADDITVKPWPREPGERIT